MEGKQGHLNREGNEKAESDSLLLLCSQRCIKEDEVARASGKKVEVEDAGQHKEGTEQGVEEEVVGRLNFTGAGASDSD